MTTLPSDAGQPRVRVLDAQGRVVDVTALSAQHITIGRALNNTISVPSKAVAPAHLRLDWPGAGPIVMVTDLGSPSGTFIEGARLIPNAPQPWDGARPLRLGEYSIKLIMPPHTPDSTPTAPAAALRPRWARWLPAVLTAAFALAALAFVAYGFLARPAEIVAFSLTADPQAASARFQVANAQRIELVVNGQPADPARLSFDAGDGDGEYTLAAGDVDLELLAYNAVGRPTRGRLTYAAPAPTEAPRPTATPRPTPRPEDVAFVTFLFNGANKVDDVTDLVIGKGEPVLIEWDVAGADGVELQPVGTFRARDAVRVAPNESTVYTLIGRNASGEARRSVKVVVVDIQATAAADATALAQAQAARDAQAAAQALAASEATAVAQATGTSIAILQAQAQAAAFARATQDAQAALAVTSTAAAQATVQVAGTVIARATQDAQAQAAAAGTAVVQATALAAEARYSQFSGTWVNDDPTTDGVTRLAISNTGPTITVQAFARCQPQDCNWGTRSRGYTGEPFEIIFDFGDGVSRRLTLAREGEALRVTDADSRGPVRVYRFSPAQ